jgi:hypothetical protein
MMSHNDEHARSTPRRIGVGLALAGAAAAATLGLTATSPAANADSVDLPVFPNETGTQTDQEFVGLAPLFTGSTFEENGTYTDLLGYNVDTTNPGYLPLDLDSYYIPNSDTPSFLAIGVTSLSDDVASVTGGTVGGSTFDEFAIPIGSPDNGFINVYEDTPFFATSGVGATDNVSDTLEFVTNSTTVEFGVQYLDLPDSTTPVDAVDEINIFGSGGEILATIPVTGDLLSSMF